MEGDDTTERFTSSIDTPPPPNAPRAHRTSGDPGHVGRGVAAYQVVGSWSRRLCARHLVLLRPPAPRVAVCTDTQMQQSVAKPICLPGHVRDLAWPLLTKLGEGVRVHGWELKGAPTFGRGDPRQGNF